MVRYYLHAQPTKGSPCNASRLTPHASRKKYSVNKAFTLAETLIVLAVMGLIVTFAVPKVIHEMGEAQKKAIGKETITALHDALYSGWQEGKITQSTTYQQLGDYLASKLNITKDCPVGRPANDCVTSVPTNFFGNSYRNLVLSNGAWINLHSANWLGCGFMFFAIDYNGATGPNIDIERGGTTTSSDVILLLFNPSQQKLTTALHRHGENFQAGSLVPDSSGLPTYNYWMGLD